MQSEKDYYKNRANEAKEDLNRVKSELDYLRRALDSENRLLVNELAELKLKTNTAASIVVPPLSPSSSTNTVTHTNSSTITTNLDTTTNIPSDIVLNSIELNIPEPPTLDLWSPSRVHQKSTSKRNKKKRTVQDLHEVRHICQCVCIRLLTSILDYNFKFLCDKYYYE